MSANALTKRYIWVDWMKAILIFLVVVGHVRYKETLAINGYLNTFIYSFHMSAFFFVSGLLHKRRSLWEYFMSLIVPYFIYGLICGIWWFITMVMTNQPLTIETALIKPILGLFTRENVEVVFSSGWFLVVLFLLKVTCDLVGRYKEKGIICTILFCMIYVFIQDNGREDYLFFLQKGIISFPFFALGFLSKRNLYKIVEKLDPKKYWIPLGLLMILLLLNLVNGRVSYTGYLFGKTPFLFYINSIIGTIFIIYISRMAEYYLDSRKWIFTLSIGTLPILGIHKIFITILLYIFQSTTNYPFAPFVIGIVVTMCCYPFIVFLQRHCPLLLGKYKSTKTKQIT